MKCFMLSSHLKEANNDVSRIFLVISWLKVYFDRIYNCLPLSTWLFTYDFAFRERLIIPNVSGCISVYDLVLITGFYQLFFVKLNEVYNSSLATRGC